MVPDIFCIQYLQENTFVRNIQFDRLLDRHNNKIPLQNYICYTVGIVGTKRIVHAFQFLFQSSNTKITSYYIRWWNTAAHETITFQTEFQQVNFWVHSGMTLRKNFFLYEDRMSLFRSTFIYDPSYGYYFRLINLVDYIEIPIKSNFQQQIFTAPTKFTYNFKHKINKVNLDRENQRKHISKILNKILLSRNLKSYVEKVSPSLFREINLFLLNGNTPGV